jgi:membrane-associated phospholipid phosphatase
MQEVALARIVAGVHYRHSTEVGLAMGQLIGEWAVSRGAAADH